MSHDWLRSIRDFVARKGPDLPLPGYTAAVVGITPSKDFVPPMMALDKMTTWQEFETTMRGMSWGGPEYLVTVRRLDGKPMSPEDVAFLRLSLRGTNA